MGHASRNRAEALKGSGDLEPLVEMQTEQLRAGPDDDTDPFLDDVGIDLGDFDSVSSIWTMMTTRLIRVGMAVTRAKCRVMIWR